MNGGLVVLGLEGLLADVELREKGRAYINLAQHRTVAVHVYEPAI